MNAEGKDIISLAIGSPDMPPSPQTIERLCEVAHDPSAHGYQPTGGTAELRNAMSDFYKRWYGVSLDPEGEIQPLIGSKEGILHITLAFCNPGDGVLVPNPGYPTYTSLSKILGQRIVNYNLREDNAWQPDWEQIEALDLSNVKLMWTNYPNMPTGGNAQTATYERLVEFAREQDIVVVNDNPYSYIINRKPLSLLQVPGAKECSIELNTMSIIHNMPGRRIGISHPQHHSHTATRRPNTPEAIMAALGPTIDPDQVGMFLWGKIPAEYADGEQLTERVLNEARVFITPGFIFGSNGERYIRISLCGKYEKMQEALERIKKVF